jgi:hypothetical protein
LDLEQVLQEEKKKRAKGMAKNNRIHKSKTKHKAEFATDQRRHIFEQYNDHFGVMNTESSQGNINDDSFYEHYEIEKMITVKCIAATCNKLRDQRFFLKKIPTHILHYSYELSGNLDSKEVLQNKDIIPEFDLLQPWLDIPPQVPIQNFVQCYGTIKFKDALYTVSDLIQD